VRRAERPILLIRLGPESFFKRLRKKLHWGDLSDRPEVVLTELRVRDLAVIADVTLPFQPGLNVLTGETGAGKSMSWMPSRCCSASAPRATSYGPAPTRR